jgi:YYY domain-containing protein
MVLLHIIALWLASTLVGAAAFPLVFSVCGRLKDRGWAVSRIIGLVLIAFLAWILSHARVLPFGTISVAFSLLVLAGVSWLLVKGEKAELLSFLKEKKGLLLAIEGIFLAFLILFLLFVALNPNIDPDSERFMDYALLGGIENTNYFPPLDPWMSGKTMNYYYYGFIVVSSLRQLVPFIPLPVFFNLVIAWLYAVLVSACFGIGYNLTGKKIYGLAAGAAIMLIGNLDGMIQVFEKGYTRFGLFNSARVMVQTGPVGEILDYPINEFPAFSLGYGDLHPYVITYPINLAILNLLLNLALASAAGWRALGKSRGERISGLLVLAIVIGCLPGAHTWDYPVYLGIAVALLVLLAGKYRPREGAGEEKALSILNYLTPAAALAAISFILYLPFNLPFLREQAGQERGGLGTVSLRTPTGLFLIAMGIFIFFLFLYLAAHLGRAGLKSAGKEGRKMFLFFAAGALIILVFETRGSFLDQTFVLASILALAALFLLLFGPLEREEGFVLIISLAALALVIFCEFFFLADHYRGGGYERMNTMFKLYTNAWLLLGTAAVYSIAYLNRILKDAPGWRFSWNVVAVLVLALGFFFPLGALGERIRGSRQPLTLDGVAYLSRPIPAHHLKEWRGDAGDWRAIEWINQNISGRPVLLEAGNMTKQDGGEAQAYVWASRVATFTGLPIPIGWANHEAGWRNDWKEPGQRQRDVELLYRTTDFNAAINLIGKYGIEYVFIGSVERDRYSEEGLAKFARIGEPVYREGPVEIWKVGR